MEYGPLISFVVPVYYSERYIDKCITSILNQTITNFEIIIIDDGSKDNSLKKCKKYEDKNKNVKVFTQKNQGVSVARNNGLSKSNGSWIVFVDSDDEIACDYIESALPYIDNYRYDLIIFDYGVSGEEYNNISTNLYSETYSRNENIELLKCALKNENLNNNWGNVSLRSPWAKIYRKSLLDKEKIVFIKNVKMGEDLLFNINVYLRANKICYVKKVLYIVDERNDSVSRSYISNMDEVDKRFYEVLNELLLKFNLPNEVWYLYYREAFVGIMRCMKYQYFNEKCKLSYKDVKQRLNIIVASEPYIKAIEIAKGEKFLNRKLIGWLLYLRWFYILKIIYNFKR